MMQRKEQIQQVVSSESSSFPHPSLFGKIRIKNKQGLVHELRVPFMQEEVNMIRLYSRGLKEICSSGFHQVPSMLVNDPFPSGSLLLDRNKAIEQMQRSAEAIERVLALNTVFKEKDSPQGKDLVSLRGRNMQILNSLGVVEEVSAVEGLQQIVDFVCSKYGKLPEHNSSQDQALVRRRKVS